MEGLLVVLEKDDDGDSWLEGEFFVDLSEYFFRLFFFLSECWRLGCDWLEYEQKHNICSLVFFLIILI